ncbi:MAG: hypothetical protein R2856_02710 [Caldilineaceae bacterium]
MQKAKIFASYPIARRQDLSEELHGVTVADPYRWMEDPDTDELRRWIEDENALTFSLLEKLPRRQEIRERMTELWDYEKFGVPFKRGGRYFFTYNEGLKNQSVLYWMPALDAEPRELLDPNTLSEDGTVALMGYAVSEDGRYLAYGLSASGSDWMEWRVRSVESGEDLTDHLQWVKFSGASWTKDGAGFFYSRYDKPAEGETYKSANFNQKLYYHSLGSGQNEDEVVYARPDHKEWGFHGHVSEDGRYLIISIWKGTHRLTNLFYQDLEEGGSVVELLTGFEADYNFVGNDGPVFYLQTDLDAPNGRLIAIDVRQPEREHWREIIAEGTDALDGVSYVGGKLIVVYLHHAQSLVHIYTTAGEFVRVLDLPGIGTVGGFGGRSDDAETFFTFTSFTTPGSIYRYDVDSGEMTLFRQPALPFDPAEYVTEQVFYPSKDGNAYPCSSSAATT